RKLVPAGGLVRVSPSPLESTRQGLNLFDCQSVRWRSASSAGRSGSYRGWTFVPSNQILLLPPRHVRLCSREFLWGSRGFVQQPSLPRCQEEVTRRRR